MIYLKDFIIINDIVKLYHYKLEISNLLDIPIYTYFYDLDVLQTEINRLQTMYPKISTQIINIEIDSNDLWFDNLILPDNIKTQDEAYQLYLNGQDSYLNQKYIKPINDSVTQLAKYLLSNTDTVKTDSEKILVSGLYEEWKQGKHPLGEIFIAVDQVWEVIQEYDTNVYLDIYPMSNAWFTFHRPLHGTSKDSAMPWIKPQYGTTDMYKKDEIMIYTDSKIYRCVNPNGTVYSPDEYAADWEEVIVEKD